MAFDLVGKAVQRIKLPTLSYDNSPIKIIPVQQGDINSRYLEVELYDSRGAIDLTPYTTALTNATLPDGTLRVVDAEINKTKNIITVRLHTSMMEDGGKVKCEVSLIGKDSNSELIYLTSQSFYLFVAESQSSGDAISRDDNYGVLVRLLLEVSELETSLRTAESERQGSEQVRNNAELERQANTAEAIANAETATQAAKDASMQAASALLAGGFLPIHNEDDGKDYIWQIIIRDGYPVLTMTEATEITE